MKKIFPLVLISIGVAMISVLSQFTIPFGPIPLTLQTLMIGIIGTIYKPSHAFCHSLSLPAFRLLRFSSICRRCWWCFAFPWSYCWFSSSSSHSEHGSRLYLPMLNPAFSLSFWPISSVVLSLCVRSYRLYAGHAPMSKKHLLWSLLLYPCRPHKAGHHHDHQQGDFCQPQTPLVFQIRFKDP